jgi:hypothetical protein
MGLSAPRSQGCFLYLEGPGDRAILEAWATRLLPAPVRRLFDSSVLLGGRRPARALDHFRTRGGRRALCVLDRDDGSAIEGTVAEEPGLEFFTWGRRHIESYLLVAPAIGRALRLPGEEARIERTLRPLLPESGDEAGWRELDAKRLLATGGPLARALGVPLRPVAIARSMRAGELHADILACIERVRAVAGGVGTAA